MNTESSKVQQSKLEHILPKTTQDAANKLANILEYPLSAVKNANSDTLEALAGTILYRHLERTQQNAVMRLVDSQPGILRGRLLPSIASVIVNPNWGLWSLSKKELEEKLAFNTGLQSLYSTLGLGFTVSAGTVAFNDYFKYRDDLRKSTSKENSAKLTQAIKAKGIKKGFITLVIWGAVGFNNNEMDKLNKELENRKPIIQSKYY